MSALTESAIARAGFAAIFELRAQGDWEALAAFAERLEKADMLVLGALADALRAREVGDDVFLSVDSGAPATEHAVLLRGEPGNGSGSGGLRFLRQVALARVLGAKGRRVGVDWSSVGMELAQVALGFGANELAGTLTTKRGLPIAEGALSGVGKKSERRPMVEAKRKELADAVVRAGRRPVFWDGTAKPGEIVQGGALRVDGAHGGEVSENPRGEVGRVATGPSVPRDASLEGAEP